MIEIEGTMEGHGEQRQGFLAAILASAWLDGV